MVQFGPSSNCCRVLSVYEWKIVVIDIQSDHAKALIPGSHLHLYRLHPPHLQGNVKLNKSQARVRTPKALISRPTAHTVGRFHNGETSLVRQPPGRTYQSNTTPLPVLRNWTRCRDVVLRKLPKYSIYWLLLTVS